MLVGLLLVLAVHLLWVGIHITLKQSLVLPIGWPQLRAGTCNTFMDTIVGGKNYKPFRKKDDVMNAM